MTPKILHFKKNTDQRGVIALLEELLEKAKSGDIHAVTVVFVMDDRVVTRSSGMNSNMQMIGAFACAQADLMKFSEINQDSQ